MERPFLDRVKEKIFPSNVGTGTNYRKCVCCGKTINKKDAIYPGNYYYLCSVECKEIYFNNSKHFYNTVIHDEKKLEEWLSANDKIEEKTYKNKIEERLESI